MPTKDLGNRHTCFKCSTKFYDMKKPDPICPKCGVNQNDAPKAQPEGRRGRLSATPKVIEPTAEPEETPASEDDEEGLESFDDDDSEASNESEDEDI
jgi:predicted  nucleic acid-binding Zn-ribbon protein